MRNLYVFTPLPPINSGIATYAYELLSYLSQTWNIKVVVEQVEFNSPDNVEVVQYAEWKKDFDNTAPILYQMGNNACHRYIYRESLLTPGVLDLHDFNLHHFLKSDSDTNPDSELYHSALMSAHGYELGERIYTYISEKRYFLPSLMYMSPLNKELLNSASAIVVHSNWAYRRVKAINPSVQVTQIPLHFQANILETQTNVARSRLNLPQDSFLISAIGHINPAKKVELIINALEKLPEHVRDIKFLLVGACAYESALDDMIENSSISTKIIRIVDANDEEFDLAISASDLIMNIRFPSAGETSGTLLRGMGFGKPCVVYDYGTFSEYPDETVIKIPLGELSSEQLTMALAGIIGDIDRLERVGNNAKAYVSKHNKISSSVELYEQALAAIPAPGATLMTQVRTV